jgi:hypothetical protein
VEVAGGVTFWGHAEVLGTSRGAMTGTLRSLLRAIVFCSGSGMAGVWWGDVWRISGGREGTLNVECGALVEII